MFTPRRVKEIEDKVRGFCVACLDPLVGSDRFDFVVDLGAELPMRTIGMLVGIPKPSRCRFVNTCSGASAASRASRWRSTICMDFDGADKFAEYVDWRDPRTPRMI